MSTFTTHSKRNRLCVFALNEDSVRTVAQKLNMVPENQEIIGQRCTRVVTYSSRKNANFSVIQLGTGIWRAGKTYEHPIDDLPKVRLLQCSGSPGAPPSGGEAFTTTHPGLPAPTVKRAPVQQRAETNQPPQEQQHTPQLMFRKGRAKAALEALPAPGTKLSPSPYKDSPAAYSSRLNGKVVTRTVPVSPAEQQAAGERQLQREVSQFQLQVTKPTKLVDPYLVYEVLEELGRGSFGRVVRAKHKSTNTEVAVKILPTHTRKQCKSLFNEVSILKKCTGGSPFVCQYVSGLFVEGHPDKVPPEDEFWIVMEFCGGGTVHDLIRAAETKSLTEKVIVEVCASVTEGLRYLHDNRIIHRDLKAGNIMMTAHGQCKIGDFGVSAQLNNTMQQRKTTCGTPLFMAPEIITGDHYSAKADIWSLGILAIQMAQGKPPHSQYRNKLSAMMHIPHMPAPTLENQSAWSNEFNDFIRCCLLKKPQRRPTAEQLRTHPFVADVIQFLGFTNGCSRVLQAELQRQQPHLHALLRQRAYRNAAKDAKANPDDPKLIERLNQVAAESAVATAISKATRQRLEFTPRSPSSQSSESSDAPPPPADPDATVKLDSDVQEEREGKRVRSLDRRTSTDMFQTLVVDDDDDVGEIDEKEAGEPATAADDDFNDTATMLEQDMRTFVEISRRKSAQQRLSFSMNSFLNDEMSDGGPHLAEALSMDRDPDRDPRPVSPIAERPESDISSQTDTDTDAAATTKSGGGRVPLRRGADSQPVTDQSQARSSAPSVSSRASTASRASRASRASEPSLAAPASQSSQPARSSALSGAASSTQAVFNRKLLCSSCASSEFNKYLDLKSGARRCMCNFIYFMARLSRCMWCHAALIDGTLQETTTRPRRHPTRHS